MPLAVKRNLQTASKKLFKTAIFLLTKGVACVIVVVVGFGRVPEWPKGTDCKSAAFSFGGSNPPSPTKKKTIAKAIVFFSYIRLWRVILLRGNVRLKPSDVALRAVLEANIISLKPQVSISLSRSENITVP